MSGVNTGRKQAKHSEDRMGFGGGVAASNGWSLTVGRDEPIQNRGFCRESWPRQPGRGEEISSRFPSPLNCTTTTGGECAPGVPSHPRAGFRLAKVDGSRAHTPLGQRIDLTWPSSLVK